MLTHKFGDGHEPSGVNLYKTDSTSPVLWFLSPFPIDPPKCVNSAPPPVRVVVDLTMEASSSANTSNAKTVLDHTSGVTPALPTPSPNIVGVSICMLITKLVV